MKLSAIKRVGYRVQSSVRISPRPAVCQKSGELQTPAPEGDHRQPLVWQRILITG